MTNIQQKIEDLDYIIGEWQICEFCKFVDNDRRRSTYGQKCSVCGEPSKGGFIFFETSVHLIVDLIKEAFNSERKVELKGTELEYELNTHYISVLLFFCTLREILLNSLVNDLCMAQKLPDNIYSHLLSDNKLHIQKQDKLFKTLTGDKWVDSLTKASKNSKHDYVKLNDKIKGFVGLRNSFSHKGASWEITREVAIDCITCIKPLILLYIALNNKYVHRIYHK